MNTQEKVNILLENAALGNEEVKIRENCNMFLTSAQNFYNNPFVGIKKISFSLDESLIEKDKLVKTTAFNIEKCYNVGDYLTEKQNTNGINFSINIVNNDTNVSHVRGKANCATKKIECVFFNSENYTIDL